MKPRRIAPGAKMSGKLKLTLAGGLLTPAGTIPVGAAACLLWFAGDMRSAGAQTATSAPEARLLAFGKEIFKSKAVCQYCHKWDASGDQGYGGNALSLRATHLTPEQLTEVVKCGRPG